MKWNSEDSWANNSNHHDGPWLKFWFKSTLSEAIPTNKNNRAQGLCMSSASVTPGITLAASHPRRPMSLTFVITSNFIGHKFSWRISYLVPCANIMNNLVVGSGLSCFLTYANKSCTMLFYRLIAMTHCLGSWWCDKSLVLVAKPCWTYHFPFGGKSQATFGSECL